MHYLTYVLVPRPDDIEEQVGRLLAGSESDPSRRFGFFQVQCACCGSLAMTKGFEVFDSSTRGQEVVRLLAALRQGGGSDSERSRRRSGDLAARACAATQEDFGRPDTACEICLGTGLFTDSRDPARHQDWWAIGGCWAQLFAGDTPGSITSGLSKNIAPFSAAVRARTPAAVVTPLGDWHEGAHRQTPDFLSDAESVERRRIEDQPWIEELATLVNDYGDHLAVVVDCHY